MFRLFSDAVYWSSCFCFFIFAALQHFLMYCCNLFSVCLLVVVAVVLTASMLILFCLLQVGASEHNSLPGSPSCGFLPWACCGFLLTVGLLWWTHCGFLP